MQISFRTLIFLCANIGIAIACVALALAPSLQSRIDQFPAPSVVWLDPDRNCGWCEGTFGIIQQIKIDPYPIKKVNHRINKNAITSIPMSKELSFFLVSPARELTENCEKPLPDWVAKNLDGKIESSVSYTRIGWPSKFLVFACGDSRLIAYEHPTVLNALKVSFSGSGVVRVLWIEMFANLLLFASLSGGIWFGLLYIRGMWRRMHGRCSNCGYLIAMGCEGRCSECGMGTGRSV